MTPDLLEQHVLSKLYFDPAGFIIAEEGDRSVGFAHAGFAPNASGNQLDHSQGITCLVMAIPHENHDELLNGLLKQSEKYLRAKGATKLLGGCAERSSPFYLGMYGGSQLPGVLASDPERCLLFERAGYKQTTQIYVLQRRLSDFRPIVDRQQMQIRRQFQIRSSFDPLPVCWWDACIHSQLNCTHFEVTARNSDTVVGSATFWDVEPLASSWGLHASGLLSYTMTEEHRTQGINVFLMGEAMRQLQSHGITVVEAQDSGNDPMFERLGFETVDVGTVFEKSLARKSG